MKKLFIALTAIVVMASCKKEKVTPPVVESAPAFDKQLKTESVTYSDGSYELLNYSFDARGRMTSFKKEYPNAVGAKAFDYSTPGKIIVNQTYNNTPTLNYDCTENSKGYITNMTIKLANGSLYQSEKFTYDANGYIIRKEMTNATGDIRHFETNVVNGNITEFKFYENGVLNYTASLTYDLTKYNSLMSPIGSNWEGSSFGKPSKNLMTSYKITRPDGAVSLHMQYNNQLDAAGYLAKRISTDLLENKSFETVYTFQ